MRKIFLLIALSALFAGCDKEPKDTTGLVGTWSVTDVVLYGEDGEVVASGIDNVNGVESYIFGADNRGSGVDKRMSYHEFGWTLEGDKLTIDIDTVWINGTDIDDPKVWAIEDNTDSKLVMSYRTGPQKEAPGTRGPTGENKRLYYRYTFSKVE